VYSVAERMKVGTRCPPLNSRKALLGALGDSIRRSFSGVEALGDARGAEYGERQQASWHRASVRSRNVVSRCRLAALSLLESGDVLAMQDLGAAGLTR